MATAVMHMETQQHRSVEVSSSSSSSSSMQVTSQTTRIVGGKYPNLLRKVRGMREIRDGLQIN